MKRIIVVGGGLGGLISAILLARKGFSVTLFEKKQYPFHRVCGEYVSNEVKDFLLREQLFPRELDLPNITEFLFSSTKGTAHKMPLDLGAFGISRYAFDHFLYQKAIEAGVTVKQGTKINSIQYELTGFVVKTMDNTSYYAHYVIGAYGKQSALDKKLNRSFVEKRNPYIGVKYHLKADLPKNLIALHNFESGYCGVSAVENDIFNMCYLGSRDVLRKHGSIEAMEEAVLKQNPHLKALIENSEFIFDKPEVINEFSFAAKSPVEQHVFMVGDAAGLITPLCGNGMAMAIHSAKILSEIFIAHHDKKREWVEQAYAKEWKNLFSQRLRVGRRSQKLFGNSFSSRLGLMVLRSSPFMARTIMKKTHGQVI